MLAISNDKESYHQYGYKTVAFVNHQTKQVHIAFAGTDPTDVYNLWDDFLLCLGRSPNKLQAVKPFIDELIQKLGEQSAEYQFSTSGHSLGAVVADIA